MGVDQGKMQMIASLNLLLSSKCVLAVLKSLSILFLINI